MRRITCAGLLASFVLVIGVGCSSNNDSGKAATTTSTTASKKSFEISTADGQVSLSLDGKLPPNWPSSFPVPNGATPAGSGSLGGANSTELVAVYNAPGTPEDAYGFYTSQSGLTVESKSSVGSGQTYVGTVKLGGDQPGRVTVVPKDGQTLIIIALTASGTGTTGTARTGTTGTAGTGTTGTGPRA